jgi:hypothetical protein
MALVEAAFLGARVSVIDLPGREHLDKLARNRAVNVVSGKFDLDRAIAESRVYTDANYLFAAELGDEEFLKALMGPTDDNTN